MISEVELVKLEISNFIKSLMEIFFPGNQWLIKSLIIGNSQLKCDSDS